MIWKQPRTQFALSLIALIVVTSLSSCAFVKGRPIYKTRFPVLQAKPRVAPCLIANKQQLCRTLLESDYQAILHELTASCLAGGGTDADCQP